MENPKVYIIRDGKMRILITGASGFVGKRLALRLLGEGHEVILFSRKNPGLPTAFIKGDVLDRKASEKCFKKMPDIIYHLAASLDETDPLLEKVNIEGMKNFLRKGIKRFILLSSVGVLGESKFPLSEDMPQNPETRYEKSKAAQERILMESGIPFTIIRSTIIYGPNSFWKRIILAAKKGYPMIGSGKNFWHLVHIDDVIEALILALKKEAENEIFNIADGDPKTYGEIYEEICRALGAKMTEKKIPVLAALLYAKIMEIAGKSDVTTRTSSIRRLVRNRIVDISKARSVLGYEPKVSFEEGIRRTIKELGIK